MDGSALQHSIKQRQETLRKAIVMHNLLIEELPGIERKIVDEKRKLEAEEKELEARVGDYECIKANKEEILQKLQTFIKTRAIPPSIKRMGPLTEVEVRLEDSLNITLTFDRGMAILRPDDTGMLKQTTSFANERTMIFEMCPCDALHHPWSALVTHYPPMMLFWIHMARIVNPGFARYPLLSDASVIDASARKIRDKRPRSVSGAEETAEKAVKTE